MAYHNGSEDSFPMQEKVNETRRRAVETPSVQEENEKNETTLTSMIENKLKNSSIYAVAKIGQSQSKFRRILWLSVLMVGLLCCGFQIYRFLSLYFKYPIIVNLEVERKMFIDFPAVTICSLNGINAHSNDCAIKDSSKWYCKEMTVTSKPFQILNGNRRYDNSTIGMNINNSIIILDKPDENFNINASTLEFSGQSAFNKANQDDKQRPNSKYLLKYGKKGIEKRKKILNTRVFIQNCFFNSESCSTKYFSHFISSKYGDCYLFKSVDKHSEPLRVSKTGISSGLELDLNMEYGYNTQTTESAGVRIAIHDRSELPDLEGGGLSITAGFETSISLRQTLTHRLPSPYKDRCVNYKTGNRYNQTDQNDCVYSCIQGWNSKICGCADPSLPIKEGFMHCDVTNDSQSSCLKFISQSVAVRETCDCPLPCISKAYNEIMSQAVWPTENWFRKKSFQEMERFRRSHARVKVYYSTLERSVLHQKPMFQESELFSHLGGELGLWLGLSLIALFEVTESLFCFLGFLVRCCCKPKTELFY